MVVSCVVLDLDNTIVPKHCLWFIVASYACLIVAMVLVARGVFGWGAVLLLVGIASMWFPYIPEQTKEAIEYLKANGIPLYANTSRVWPFVSPKTLCTLNIPLSRVFFRSAWNKPLSKARNMARIQLDVNFPVEKILFVDDDLQNINRVKLDGYATLHTTKLLQKPMLQSLVEKKYEIRVK